MIIGANNYIAGKTRFDPKVLWLIAIWLLRCSVLLLGGFCYQSLSEESALNILWSSGSYCGVFLQFICPSGENCPSDHLIKSSHLYS